jgi:PAP2 superfamily
MYKWLLVVLLNSAQFELLANESTANAMMHESMEFVSSVFQTDHRFVPPVAAKVQGALGLTFYRAIEEKTASETEQEVILWAAATSLLDSLLYPLSATNQRTWAHLSQAKRELFQTLLPKSERLLLEEKGRQIGQAVFKQVINQQGRLADLTIYDSGFNPEAQFGKWSLLVSQTAILPYWGDGETFFKQNKQRLIAPPPPVSLKADSPFFLAATEVMETVDGLTPAQKALSFYWSDGAATLTPPGHSMGILIRLLKQKQTSVAFTAKAYALAGLSMSDALQACWFNKYHYNLVRPLPFIKEFISPTWKTAVPTPPFPEYPSGHATQAGAFAKVIEYLFGVDQVLEDNNTMHIPNQVSTYLNADALSREVAQSRLYGGIHYRFSNEAGLQLGRDVAKDVIDAFFVKPDMQSTINNDSTLLRHTSKVGVFTIQLKGVEYIKLLSMTGLEIRTMKMTSQLLDLSEMKGDAFGIQFYDRANTLIGEGVFSMTPPRDPKTDHPHSVESLKLIRQ